MKPKFKGAKGKGWIAALPNGKWSPQNVFKTQENASGYCWPENGAQPVRVTWTVKPAKKVKKGKR